MKKVLIITTHFAPDRHVGAKRPTQFAKFLPEYGWQPAILTKEVRYYHGIDETLNEELSPYLPIHRVHEWHLYGAKMPNGKASANDKGASGSDRLAKQRWISYVLALIDIVLFYDYSWIFPAFFTGLRLLRQQGINLIYSTSPNPDAHILALLLKALTGVKWVCEYRDPWTSLVTSYTPCSVAQQKVDKYLEKLTMRKSDCIVTVGKLMKENFAKLVGDEYNDKISVIYNGYNKKDFVGVYNVGRQSDKFVIAYLGTWGHLNTPELFLKALGSLLRKKEYLRERMRVDFIGEVKFDAELAVRIEQVILEENLGTVVHRAPFVPHKEGLSYLYTSDVLLLVVGADSDRPDGTDHRLTSKLFEYLYVRKPILALVPPDGEAARLIHETNAGEIVHPTDIKGIENKIYEMYQAFKNGELKYSSKQSEVAKYDRRKQTGDLAKIFNSLS